MPRPRPGALALAALAGAALPALALADLDDDTTRRPAVPARAQSPLPARRTVLLGRSVRGRPIRALVLRGRAPGRPVLVVGCIHGSEPAGIRIASRLATGPRPARGELWIVPDLNPDGVVAGTRQNARGVDLNRNFPYRWRPLDPLGGLHYAGRRPLSEPESRIAARLVRRLRPRLAIYFHQALAVTDRSGGNPGPERRFARLSGLPLARLPRYPGSAVEWEDHLFPRSSAFVVELRARVVAADERRYARAALTAG